MSKGARCSRSFPVASELFLYSTEYENAKGKIWRAVTGKWLRGAQSSSSARLNCTIFAQSWSSALRHHESTLQGSACVIREIGSSFLEREQIHIGDKALANFNVRRRTG